MAAASYALAMVIELYVAPFKESRLSFLARVKEAVHAMNSRGLPGRGANERRLLLKRRSHAIYDDGNKHGTR